MKSMIPAAVLAGALAFSASSASAATVSVFSNMSPVTVSSGIVGGIPANPETHILNVATDVTALIRLLDTSPDNIGTIKVQYDIFEDANNDNVADGAAVYSFYKLDNNTGPSTWYSAALLGSVGKYLLSIETLTSGATHSDSEISAVPLPGAALLFGSALLGMGALRRKQAVSKAA